MRTSLAPILLLALLLPAACRAIGPQALSDESVRLELGRQVVATLDRQEHYFEEPGARAAFERRLEVVARSTPDADGYYRGLSAALASLNEGHTGLVGSGRVKFADTIPPVAIVELPEGLVVAGVAPGIESSMLQPGDLILEVEARPVAEVVAERILETAGSTPHGRRARAIAHLLAGPLNTPARVRVQDIHGQERVRFPLRFLLDDEGRYRQRFGFLPETLRAQRIDAASAYIALPDFEQGRAEEFFEAIRPLRNLPVLVLDLRGNPGGRIQTLQQIAGAFCDDSTGLLRMQQAGTEETVYSTEAPVRFRGDVRILMDARTGSAAELFAAALQDVRHARLVGERTAGSTRSRRTARLPGGVLFHYAGRAEFRRIDGRPIEGIGVVPDVDFLPTRVGLAGGHFGDAPGDPAVQRALALN